MRRDDGMERIRIIAPKPGACRVCAAKHDPEMPHEKNSLYYQMRFQQKHGRFPTWEDAMAHCSENVKAEQRRKLNEAGIITAPTQDDGR